MILWWNRLGRSDAINLTGFIAVTVLQTTGAFLISDTRPQGRDVLFLGLALLSMLPVGAFLMLGKLLLKLHLPAAVKPLITISVFQLSALSRAFAFDQLLIFNKFSTQSEFMFRLIGTEATVFLGLMTIASLVTYARDFTERNSELSQSLSSLSEEFQSVSIRLESQKNSLVNRIQDELLSGISGLSGKNLELDAEQLKYLLDDVVRPLSYQLGREFERRPIQQIPQVRTEVNWREIVLRTLVTNPVHPMWFTLWASIGTFQFYRSRNETDFFLPLIGSIVLIYTVQKFCAWLWDRIPTSWGTGLRAATFSSFSVLSSIAANSFVHVLSGLNTLKLPMVLGVGLFYAVLSWLISLLITSSNSLKKINSELITANRAIKRKLVTENASARHFESELSRVLHGSVQDAIAASLKKVESFPRGTELTAEDLIALRSPIEDSLRLLLSPDLSTQNVKKAVNDLSELWSGVVEIDVALEEKAISALESSNISSGIAIEIIREAVSNAIRHGNASKILIKVSLEEQFEDAHIEVSNNGSPVSAASPHGIGSTLLDELALHWERTNQFGEVKLKAVIPVKQ